MTTSPAASLRRPFYLKMAAIGTGFFGLTLVWAVYNTYMPLLLGTFIDSGAVRGLVMGLDNALAILLLPLIGAWSDRVRGPLGGRLPFIIVGMPLAALLFALLPLSQGALWLLLGVDVLFLLAMTLFRAPVIALMPDHAPPERRAAANGVINLMGGLGGILAFFALAPLYDRVPGLPFWVAGALLLGAFAVLLRAVARRPPFAARRMETDVGVAPSGVLGELRQLGRREHRAALLILTVIALYTVGFSGLEAQFSIYATEGLGLSGGRAGLLLGFFSLAFVACALPAGLLGSRFGKLPVLRAGLLALPVLFLLIPLTGALPPLLLLVGAAWALVNVQAYPLVADLGGGTRTGFYTGLYYLFSMSAAALGPGLTGLMMDLLGTDALFYASAGTFVLAFAVLSRLRSRSPVSNVEGSGF